MSNVTVVDGVREITGVVFHILGKEFIATLNKRVEEHKAQAKEAAEALPGAEAAAQATQEALAVAGRSSKSAPGGGLQLESAVAYAAPAARARVSNRDYGGSVEDAVQALKNAIVHHSSRAITLKFYADHLKPDVEYVLSPHDVNAYELLGSDEDEG